MPAPSERYQPPFAAVGSMPASFHSFFSRRSVPLSSPR
jgi:hypothetical protein